MSIKKKTEDKAMQRYKRACEDGVCPSLTEIKNRKIRKLAERLTGSSDRETLTNISEWHNNKMTYWFERYPLLYYSYLSTIPPVVFFGATAYFPIAWWPFAISMTVTVTLFIITAFMVTNYRNIPLSEALHILDKSISIDFLLDRKLAVCRDYAKLSAALLFNIYPEKEIYFVYAPRHVSIGMMIGSKPYILDKYLPITTFLKWNEKWNKGKVYKKVKRAKDGRMFFFDDPNTLLLNTKQSELDPCKLSSKLEQIMGIQSSTDYSRDNSLQIMKLTKGAKLYEDDEIINYSIARRLESVICDEILDKNQIAHIEVKREKDDLVFLVYMK
ncbi:MAG: hypothetical protein NWE94_09805 [Candidatus Bathyarchaeota archaeon]|nr:hypothetical protein [Candidatus Bathyarchaeota archaeon]